MLYKTSLLLFLLLIMINAEAQKTTSPPAKVNTASAFNLKIQSRVDSFVNSKMKEHHTAGLSLAVMRDNKLLYTKSYGYSNLEHKLHTINETVYSIASITKTFTGIATMMLVEEGKLSLEDRIGKYFLDLPPIWKTITIRQLLNHTSGISSPADYKKIPCAVGKDVRDYVRGDMLKEVACLPLLFAPGDSTSYSDTGPYLLGMLIDKISGTSYEDFVKQRIFDPLQMHHSRLLSFVDLIPNRADGYAFRNGKHYLAKRLDIDFANAGIVSTALDMVQLHHAFRSEKLLKKNNWKLMWTNARLNNGDTTNFGLGFGLTPFQGKRRIGHYGGSGLGFAGGISHFLDQDLTVVVLTNTDNPEIGTLLNTVASYYFK